MFYKLEPKNQLQQLKDSINLAKAAYEAYSAMYEKTLVDSLFYLNRTEDGRNLLRDLVSTSKEIITLLQLEYSRELMYTLKNPQNEAEKN